MKKVFIKNRKGQKLAIILQEAENSKGLVFVMHGLGGFKEQPHIQVIADAFSKHPYDVVRFEDATITSYYADLEDVIKWATTQPWYRAPFILVGHSLGGICVGLYAENHPEQVRALAPIATTVSGKLSFESKEDAGELSKWRDTGWREEISVSRPGVIKRLPWSHMEDRLKYDLLPFASRLAMPVLMVVGERDTDTSPNHQKILFNMLPGPKEIHVIKGSEHSFRGPGHLQELGRFFSLWIDSLNQT